MDTRCSSPVNQTDHLLMLDDTLQPAEKTDCHPNSKKIGKKIWGSTAVLYPLLTTSGATFLASSHLLKWVGYPPIPRAVLEGMLTGLTTLTTSYSQYHLYSSTFQQIDGQRLIPVRPDNYDALPPLSPARQLLISYGLLIGAMAEGLKYGYGSYLLTERMIDHAPTRIGIAVGFSLLEFHSTLLETLKHWLELTKVKANPLHELSIHTVSEWLNGIPYLLKIAPLAVEWRPLLQSLVHSFALQYVIQSIAPSVSSSIT